MTIVAESPDPGLNAAGFRAWIGSLANEPADSIRHPGLLRGCLLSLVDATPGLVMVSSSTGRLLYMNEMGRRMLGIDPDASIMSRKVFDTYAPASCDLLLAEAIPVCLRAGVWRGEMALLDSTGREIPVSQVLMAHHVREQDGNETTLLSSIAWDIREMKQVEYQLRHQATHDALTGLPNRAQLMDNLEQALRTAESNQTCVAVLFLDLDGFKQINDSRGHETANQLLRALGQRLKSRLRAQDVVARYGGDEFVILVPDLSDRGDVNRVIQKVQEVLWEPFLVGGESVWINASTGLAISPTDGCDAASLLQRADSDMYRQKRQMKTSF